MAKVKLLFLVAFFIFLVAMEATIVQADDDKGNGGDDKNKGKGDDDQNKGRNGDKAKDNGNSKGKGIDKAKPNPPKKPAYDDVVDYETLQQVNGQERARCKAKGTCNKKTLTCPAQCPERKPKKNKKQKGCLINCSSKCEATCKLRKANCDGYGSLCYDPRFVGGDGVMFYFHGAKGGNFAIVSDESFQINAHFIGTRPQGRARDFTWVQALSVLFDIHTLVIVANRVSHWDEKVDSLTVKWDGETVHVPIDEEVEWRVAAEDRHVVVERTDDANSVRVTVSGVVEMDINVRPIGKEENRIHSYQLPADDAFAHLETQFRFFSLTDNVEGILGKTYRPNYVTPVKVGVPMPMMGGEDKYQIPSLYSTFCGVCRFHRQSGVASSQAIAQF